MLTVTLRSLERDGLLSRTVHNVMPNVSYQLAPMGTALLDATAPMLQWSAEYDARAGSPPG